MDMKDKAIIIMVFWSIISLIIVTMPLVYGELVSNNKIVESDYVTLNSTYICNGIFTDLYAQAFADGNTLFAMTVYDVDTMKELYSFSKWVTDSEFPRYIYFFTTAGTALEAC